MKSLTIRAQIILIVCAPLLAMTIIGALQLSSVWNERSAKANIVELMELSVAANNVVHELQKERGSSAGFLASKGEGFADTLSNARTSADAKLEALRHTEASIADGVMTDSVANRLADINGDIRKISDMRRRVSAQAAPVKDAVAFYTALNGKLLSLTAEIIQHTADVNAVFRAAAYLNFLQSKERAGIERAVGSQGFSIGWNTGIRTRHAALVAEQDAYLSAFEVFASASQKAALKTLQQGKSFSEIVRLRAAGYAGEDIDSQYWFGVMTQKINELKAFEDDMADNIVAVAQSEKTAKIWQFGGLLAVVLGVICVAVTGVLILINRIVSSMKAAADSLTLLAKGDLTQEFDTHRTDEIGILYQSMDEMSSELTRIVGGIGEMARTVAASSKEIAAGNGDLSHRTEEQASNLEETASAMEQMTATVRHNTDNAIRVRTIADEASAQANSGAQEIDAAVTAMSAITESSSKISAIVSLIDEIAFQTNLLALNASVEAARAGEQGRGFAVVASEVRLLAGNSANAAQQIKALIEESAGRVEEGASLVGGAGKTLSALQSAIAGLSDDVANIANSSQEQLMGIEQVNQAIAQMDTMTQNNAALVEQSAASAENLEHLAEDLNHATAIFKLKGNPGLYLSNR